MPPPSAGVAVPGRLNSAVFEDELATGAIPRAFICQKRYARLRRGMRMGTLGPGRGAPAPCAIPMGSGTKQLSVGHAHLGLDDIDPESGPGRRDKQATGADAAASAVGPVPVKDEGLCGDP